jgi:sugar phosphate isomerase/epimerase
MTEENVKYAICNELFGDLPWEQGFQLARRYGYTGLEVAPFTLANRAGNFSLDDRQRYRSLAEAHGLEVVGLHWLLAKTEGFHLTTRDASVRRRTADYLVELAQLCVDLGGRLMVLGSPQQRNFGTDMTHDEAMENAADTLSMVAPALANLKVRIAIEPLGPKEGNFLFMASQAVELIHRIDSPWIRLHLDVKAMSTESKGVDAIIRENAAYMIHFHANDPNLLGPGMGDMDFVPIFRALRDIHYEGWVSVEVFDYSPGIETILRESMNAMRAAAEKA